MLQLHLAALGKCVDTIRTLISEGVVIDLPDVNGETALHLAKRYNDRKSVEVLEYFTLF